MPLPGVNLQACLIGISLPRCLDGHPSQVEVWNEPNPAILPIPICGAALFRHGKSHRFPCHPLCTGASSLWSSDHRNSRNRRPTFPVHLAGKVPQEKGGHVLGHRPGPCAMKSLYVLRGTNQFKSSRLIGARTTLLGSAMARTQKLLLASTPVRSSQYAPSSL